jgi:hypothetical protein
LKQIYVLALLGRVDDARARVEKMRARFPTASCEFSSRRNSLS